MNISYAETLPEFQKDTNVPLKDMLEGFQLEPSLTVTESYDSNIDLSGGLPTHDYITTVSPRLTLSYKGLTVDSSLSYQADAQFFSENPQQNTVKHLANLNAGYRLSQTTEFRIQDGFIYSPDATDIAPTGVITPRTNQYSNTVSAIVSHQLSLLTSVSAVYNYAIQRYESSNLADSAMHGIQLTLSHSVSPTDIVSANAGFRYFSFDDRSRHHRFSPQPITSQKVYTASLGWIHHFSDTFILDATGGVNLFQDQNNQYTPSGLFNVGLKNSWKYTTLDLRYLHDLSVSGGGVTNSTLLNQSVVLSMQETLTEKLRANLSGSYATNKSVSGIPIDTVSYSGTAGLDYDITAWLKGQLRYSYFQQDSHATAGSDFRRHQVFAGLTATLPK